MKCETSSSSLSKDAQILGLAIARAIQVSKDEKDAIHRICTLLNIWEVKMAPNELGSLRQDP